MSDKTAEPVRVKQIQFKLTGRNFQAWKSFELPVGGFTLIVGSSNRGKSALLRSLRGVLRNEVAQSHIRYGTKETTVGIETEGLEATLTRTPKTSTYKINQQDFAKLAGETPEPLKAMKMDVVEVGNLKLDPIFAGQFDGQFMLNLSPAELNSVLGLFSSTERLQQGKKAVASSNQDINAEAKVVADSIQSGHIRLSEAEEVKDWLTQRKETYEELVSSISNSEVKQQGIQRLQSGVQTARKLNAFASAELPSTDKLTEKLRICRLLHTLLQTKKSVGDLKAVAEYPIIESDGGASFLAPGRLLQRLIKARAFILGVPEITLPDTTPCLTLAKTMIGVSQYLSATGTCEALADRITTLDSEIESLQKELAQLSKDLISCPKCGHKFTR